MHNSYKIAIIASVIINSFLYLNASLPPRKNQSVNNTYNPSIIIDNHHTITTTSKSTAEAIGNKIENFISGISEAFKKATSKENYHLIKTIIKELLWQYRYRIVGGTIIGSYSTMSLFLAAKYHQLSSLHWAHWKEQYTFENLCSISQKELAKELLLAIGQHHYNKDNPTDHGYQLVAFIKNIDEEIGAIKQYIAISKVLKQLHLIPIFPTNENKINNATKLLERAIFIKHIFLSWLADYNLLYTEKISAA